MGKRHYTYIIGQVPRKKRLAPFMAAVFTLALVLPVALRPMTSDALSGSQFNAERIIDDAVFHNRNSMSATEIQAFLNSKVPDCDTNGEKPYGNTTRAAYGASRGYSKPYTCLRDYHVSTSNIAPESGLCSGYTGASNESAARIIYKVAQSCGINPQVILVMLQKEQGLVTDDWPWSIQYKKAMGAFCPDTASCDPAYTGFFKQVYYGSERFKVYEANKASFSYRAERNNTIRWHPRSACGSSRVFIQNQATANLYIYTPYRPNRAALNNLYGTGDSCSSYGNRNFWRMFYDWFGPPTGTPLFRFGTTDAIYILGANNNYYHIPSRQILEAYGYGSTISSVKGVKPSSVGTRTFSGSLPPIARFEGSEIYLLDDGRAQHFTSRDLLQDYGFDIGQEALLPTAVKEYLPTGEDMQTTAKNAEGPEVYSVEDGKKRHVINSEAYQSGSPPYISRAHVSIDPDILARIENGAPILTSNKLLYRTDRGTFAFWDGLQRYDVRNIVASELRMSVDYATRASMINQLPASSTNINKFVKNSGGDLFILDTRRKLQVSSADLTEMGLTTSSFPVAPNGFFNEVPTTHAFKRIFRINGGSAVYVIEDGKRHHLHNPAAVAEKGFALSEAISVSDSSANLFPDSGKKILATGTLFRINSGNTVYVTISGSASLLVPTKALMDQYGFSFKNVQNLSSKQASGYPSAGSLDYFVKDGSNNVWHPHQGSRKLPVSASMQGASAYNLNVAGLHVLPSVMLDKFTTQSGITNLIQAVGDTKVYKIENGTKRWVTTKAAFDANGFSLTSITPVSFGFARNMPNGPAIN